jgi:nucleotide-binding universal stress UspA family protein
VRAAILEAELLAALGLADRALVTAAEALAAIPEPGPESDRLLEIAATAAVESGRREAADAAMAAIARRPGLRPRARRLQVELFRRTGRPAEALAVLDALLPEEIAPAGFDATSIARLKSELALAAGDPMRAAREIESLPPPAEKTP